MSPGEKIGPSSSSKLYSLTSDNCKILADTNKINSSDHEMQFISSPIGKWSVEKNHDTTMIYEKSIDGNNISVKRVLFVNDEYKKNEKSCMNLKLNLLFFHY